MKPKIINRQRGGYRYQKCKKCGTSMQIDKPYHIMELQCTDCGAILVGNFNNFCDKCGAEVEARG